MIDRIVYMTGDDEIATHSRSGPGYVALSIAFSRLRYSYKTEEDLRQALAEAFGPISFSTSEDLGAVSLLLFYFESDELEHDVDPAEARKIVEGLVSTWEDRAFAAMELPGRRAAGPQALRQATSAARAAAGSTARRRRPRRCRRTSSTWRTWRAGWRSASCRARADTVALKLYTTTSVAPHRHPAHAAEPRARP